MIRSDTSVTGGGTGDGTSNSSSSSISTRKHESTLDCLWSISLDSGDELPLLRLLVTMMMMMPVLLLLLKVSMDCGD